MRPTCLTLILIMASLGVLCVGPSGAQAQWWGCGGHYGPFVYHPGAYPMGYYYSPYAGMYYSPYYAPRIVYSYPVTPMTNGEYRAYRPELYNGTEPTTVTVGLYDNYFKPAKMNIAPGTTVHFTNYGQHAHTVTAQDDSWDSGDVQPNGTFSAIFRYPGTYHIYCRHHTKDQMQGTIVVGDGAASPSDNGRETSSGNGKSGKPGY